METFQRSHQTYEVWVHSQRDLLHVCLHMHGICIVRVLLNGSFVDAGTSQEVGSVFV